LFCSICRSTLRERAIDVVEAEGEAIVGVVNAIESQINHYLVSTFPAGWRGTLHGFFVHIVGWNVFGWGIFLIEFDWAGISILILGRVSSYLPESASNCLHALRNI
jgi:hypothetical protein